jgi:hypothetical protein
MTRRSLATTALAAFVLLAACGGDDAGFTTPKNTTTAGTDATDATATTAAGSPETAPPTDGSPGSLAPAPSGTLAPSADPTLLLAGDLAADLADLGFAQGWVRPGGGATDVVGVYVHHERGDRAVFSTYRTAYLVPTGDPEEIAKAWAGRFADALKVQGIDRLGTIKGNGRLSVVYSSSADAATGAPKLRVSAIATSADASAPIIVEAEFRTVDVPFPDVSFPTDLDPTLPTLDGCTARRVDVDYHAYSRPDTAPGPASYKLWWEGSCPTGDAFTSAAAWARANGQDVGPGTTSFTATAVGEDKVSIQLSASHQADGDTGITLIIDQPATPQ